MGCGSVIALFMTQPPILWPAGGPVQVGANAFAVTCLGSPEPGGTSLLAAEASLQPVYLDLWGKHDRGCCGGSAPLPKPQRVLPTQAEASGTACLWLAQCGKAWLALVSVLH